MTRPTPPRTLSGRAVPRSAYVILAALLTAVLARVPPVAVVPGYEIDLVGVPALVGALLLGPFGALASLPLFVPGIGPLVNLPLALATLGGSALTGLLQSRRAHPAWTWGTWLALRGTALVAAAVAGTGTLAAAFDARLGAGFIDAIAEITIAWTIVLAAGASPSRRVHRRSAPPLAHLSFTSLAVFVAAVSLVTSLVYVRFAYSDLRADAQAELRARATRVGEILGSLLLERQRLTETIAEGLGARGFGAPLATGQLDAALARVLQVNPSALSMLAIDANGTVMGAGANRSWLRPRDIVGTSVADREYFRAPMRTGRPYVSGVFTGRGMGSDRLIALSAPVPGQDGRPAGVVQIALDLSDIARVVTLHESPDVATAVIDAQGAFVVPPAFGQAVGRGTSVGGANVGGANVGTPAALPDLASGHWLSAESRIESTGWRVVSFRTRDSLAAGVTPAARQALYLVAFGLFAAFWLGRAAAQWLLVPIARASAPLERPGGARVGVLAVRQRHVPSEIRRLLQRMQKSQIRQRLAFRALARLRQELDRKVLERTAELEESRRRLAQSAERWQQLLELSPDPIVTIDAAGRIRFANFAAEALGGTAGHSLSGRSVLHLVPDWPAVASGLAQAAGGPSPRAAVEVAARRNGRQPFPAELAVAEVRDGEERLYVVVVRDLTVRRATEDALRRAKQDAEAASAAKTMFLAVISHELRTPLNAILNAADLMRPGTPEAERESYRRTLIASAEAMLKVVGDLLDLTSIEAGQFRIRTAPADVRAELTQAVESFAGTAQSKGLELRIEIGALPPAIETDAARLQQIVRNLVGNALKFTRAGYVGVRASVVKPARGLPQLVVEVSDSGIGIPEEARRRIFEPFVQQDGSISRAYGGTGLGLAISSRFAAMLGGSLQVESRVGVGSTFRLALPLVAAAAPAATPTSTVRLSQAAATSAPPVTARPVDVLVVDDTDTNRLLAERMLEIIGHRVTVCASGAEALDAIRRQRFDVVLMDVSMPEMDGFETTRRLREIERARDGARAWVVGFTAHATPADADACRANGMDDVVTKPYRARDLHAAIERAPLERSAA